MIGPFQGQYRYLSNFYMCPLVFQHVSWPSIEHAFQAHKTTNESLRERIRRMDKPREAKRAGRSVPLRHNWERIKYMLMWQLVRQKFLQNRDLAEKLVSTGDEQIVEKNHWHDNEWGDCTCERCTTQPGRNCLGRILMTVRHELQDIGVDQCQS